MAGGRPKEWTEEKIQESIAKLREWADKDETVILSDYAVYILDITPQALRGVVKGHPQFSAEFNKAKRKIAGRRELKGLNGEFNAGLVAKTMNRYDECQEETEFSSFKSQERFKSNEKIRVAKEMKEEGLDELSPSQILVAQGMASQAVQAYIDAQKQASGDNEA